MSSEIKVDTISENTSAGGITIDGVLVKDNGVEMSGAVKSDTISEKTSANGVAIDGLTLKDGNVVPATGKGIDFSAKADTGTGESATGSKLTDYEQGTFTSNPTTDGTDYTTSSRGGAGFYTKIGDWVSIQLSWFVTTPSGTASSGSLEITGLPFVCNASGNSVVGTASFGRQTIPSGVQTMSFVYDNEAKVRFFASVSGGSSGAFSADNLEGYITPFGQVFVSYPCD